MSGTTPSLQRLSQDIATDSPVVEVVDAANRPLLHMPLELVRRQRLRHKAVAVCLRNKRGHIFLHKPSAGGSFEQAGQWSFSATGRVFAAESCHDAALRELRETLAVTELDLYEAGAIAPCAVTENAEVFLFLSAKTAAIPQMREQDFWDGMFVDKEEFAALVRDFPYMVAPLLQLAAPRLFTA